MGVGDWIRGELYVRGTRRAIARARRQGLTDADFMRMGAQALGLRSPGPRSSKRGRRRRRRT